MAPKDRRSPLGGVGALLTSKITHAGPEGTGSATLSSLSSYDPNTVNRQGPASRKFFVNLRWQIRTCVPEDRCETDVLMHSLISAGTAARAARTSPLPARRRVAV